MTIKKILIIFVAASLSFWSVDAVAQDSEDYEYTSEFIWGINKNTNSGLIGGLIFKYSRALNPRVFQTFGLEIINVKHPKEQRYASLTGNYFIWGKSNYLYALRPQYGREMILFKKAPQQGIQINASFAGGPTIGILAPYLIEVSSQNANGYTSRYEQYDPLRHDFSNILGTGNIFQGIGQSNIKIGANIKTSLVFEFGTFKNNVTGFETGFLVEAFPEKIILVPLAQNQSVYTSAFITLFYGSRR